MKDSTEEKRSTTETQDTTETHDTNAPKAAAKTGNPKKLHRISFFLKHILRFFAIIGCFVGCSYFLIISTNRLNSGMILQEFEGTSSVGDENLQITVCPVAPFEQVLSLDFRSHTRRANNLRGSNMALLNRPDFTKSFAATLECMYRSQYVHRDATIEEKLNRLRLHPECMIDAEILFTSDYSQDVLEIYTWIRSYITLYMLDLHKEGDVDFYQGIYKNIDLLKQDNATLPEFLKGSSRDLEDYITSDFTDIDNVNLNQPTQKVVVNSLRTRFGPSCTTYTLAGNEDGKKLNQRYGLRMTFNRVEHAYLLVFVNENRTFSDIPGASIIQPYRIPLDTSSVLHIRRIEKTTKSEALENCRSYDKRNSPGSRVECMEACLLKKVVTDKNITCLMPWMARNSTRGLTTKSFCTTFEDYLNTRQIAQRIFRGNTSDCNTMCVESCEKLNILVKSMGLVRATYHNEGQRRHVVIIVSNEMDKFKNRPAYGWGEFTSEMFGSLSFILGIAFVALIDWIFATLLWLCGKLPYIPAMPPIINSDLYVRDIYYHVRHEVCGDPIPMTISQTYLRTHEYRRDAFKAAQSSTEKPVTDHRQPHFPRMHHRKSSLAIMSEALAAVSHHHDEALLREQFKSLSEALSRQEASVRRSSQQRSSYRLDVSSQQHISRVQPPGTTSSSVHDVQTKLSEPRITVSAPDEDADDTGQRSPTADTSAPQEEADVTGRGGHTAAKGSLPGIERDRRPSRAASVLRDLDAAEASRTAGAEDEVPPPSAPPAAARERRRSSTYRTKPRRKSHAVAPAPAPELEEHSDDDEAPD